MPIAKSAECEIEDLSSPRRFPLARVGRVEDGFDYGHVLDGVFDRDRNFGAIDNRFGEGIALQGVLIADGKGFGGNAVTEQIAAAVDQEAGGTIHRRVEGNLDLEATASAKEVDALVRDQLRTAGENGLAPREVEKCRRETVGMHLGIAVDEADDPRRLLSECIAGCMHKVAADVQECTSTARDLVVDAGRVHLEVAEEADDRMNFSDAAFGEQFAEAEPLRIAAAHEGLAEPDPSTGANSEEGFGLGDGETERLLAENVLASFGSSDGPRDMEMIGKRIVDGVDIRVSDEFFVRTVSRGNAESGRRLLGLRQAAGCDGDDPGVLALLHGGNDFLADAGGAENSPAELAGHVYRSSICVL